MKFPLASAEGQTQVTTHFKAGAIAWAISWGVATTTWAIAIYLIEREKQRARVELARLEIEAKRLQVRSEGDAH